MNGINVSYTVSWLCICEITKGLPNTAPVIHQYNFNMQPISCHIQYEITLR